ncbi:MAG TPA: hypothetical protein VGQ10_02060 [Vicinamibacterales bacterium]|jgi:hypothetical protein|nr:hypothetical protein [Vicinamibacterales bacterium]
MKGALGQLTLALLLVAAGAGLWKVAAYERDAADAYAQMGTLRFARVVARTPDADVRLAGIDSVPWLSEQIYGGQQWRRTLARYWLGQYSEIADSSETEAPNAHPSPELLLLRANAAFRDLQRSTADRAAKLKGAEAVIQRYAQVLKSTDLEDAAYNYEYVVRVRNALAKPAPGREQAALLASLSQKASTATKDLPEGRTIHGHPGEYPVGTGMSPFNTIIPMETEERDTEIEAGVTGRKQRKG